MLGDREKLISKFNMNAMPYISIFCCPLLDVHYRSVTATEFTVPQNDRVPAGCILMHGAQTKCEFVTAEFSLCVFLHMQLYIIVYNILCTVNTQHISNRMQ